MKILIGMPDPNSRGGPAACEPPFVAALRRQGIEVKEATYVYGEGARRTPARQRVARVWRTARLFRQLMRSEHFDVIHLNTAFDPRALMRDAVVLSTLPQRRRGKLFLKLHGSDANVLRTRNIFWRRLRNYILKRVDAIGVLSTEERRNFISSGVANEKIFVVKNAVEPLCAPESSSTAVRHGNMASDAPVLLFIARFIPAKGLLDAVRACRLLVSEGRQFTLACVGDGPARLEAEREVARLDLGGVVRFSGYVPEAETDVFYCNSTMLVFPTYHEEGFPMTLFRAIAAGLPIITTRIRAAADYLREPDNCLWTAPRQPAQLAARISFLLDRGDWRARMKTNNLRLAKEFTAARVTAEYVEIYRKLIARS